MALSTEAVGKTWPAVSYEVGREKIREYALVLGFDSPVYFDADAARAEGFRDVVAPPISSGAVKPWRCISLATWAISSSDGVMSPESPMMSAPSAATRRACYRP